MLTEYGLRDRMKVIATGKLVTPAEVAWVLATGADFINSHQFTQEKKGYG